MSLLTRLKTLFQTERERDAHDLLHQARTFYTDAMHRAEALQEQSDLAPHAAGRDGLRELASEEREVAERLRKMIHQLGSFAGDVRRPEPPYGALNYWARLTQSLEAHREAIKALLDESALVTDSHPELADELRFLARFEDSHAARLRGLIAKSDPQALD